MKKFVYLATASETDQINPAYNNQPEPSNLKQFLHSPDFFSQYQISAACNEYQKYIKDSLVFSNNLLE